jgi:gluconolactonase
MFSAPLSLTTETAYELPAYLHESGAHHPWVAAHLAGREVHSHLAGGCFDAEGRLWLADLPFGRVFRVTPTGEWDLVAKYDGWPAQLAFHYDGRLLVADQRHGVLAMNMATQKIEPFVTHHASRRFLGVSALLLSTGGTLYFSDSGLSGLTRAEGAVYRLDADGVLTCLADNLPGPAGLALADDGGALLVAMARDNAVWRLPLVDGQVARAGRFIAMSGGFGPAGLALDSDGNLYVAHHGLGAAWQFDRRGEPKTRIDSSRGDWITGVLRHPHQPHELYLIDAQTASVLRATMPLY